MAVTRAGLICALLVAGAAWAATAHAEDGPRWQDLRPAERSVLKPLERDWASIDASRKQKWRDIAARHPSLPPAEQARISQRMTAWASMTPAERGRARLNFQEARQLTPQDRQARWDAYQALPPERRQQLATRAVPPAPPRPADDGSQGKSNIVPSPADAARRKPTAPTVVQAAPGATTTLITRKPSTPPSHQQPGMPKIAATPGFVDKSTLLPKRGAQGAATRSAAAPDDSKPAPTR